MRVLGEKIVPLYEVEAMLKKRQKEGEALSYEQQNTLEYAEGFGARLPAEKYKELKKDLADLGLPEKTVAKLCDILPRKEEEVRVVVSQDKSELSDDQVKEIAKTLKKYVKK